MVWGQKFVVANSGTDGIAAGVGNLELNEAKSDKNTTDISLRPGKFLNLAQFAKPEDPNAPDPCSNQLNHRPFAIVNTISPGHIIHIEDTDNNESRIHDRIMLVLAITSTTTVKCLSFCTHKRSDLIHKKHCLDHAELTSGADDNTTTTSPSSKYFKLHVSLESGDCKLKPEDDAYINLKEEWNVETLPNVTFAILGEATEKYWSDAQEEIIKVLVSTIGGSAWLDEYVNSRVSDALDAQEEKNKAASALLGRNGSSARKDVVEESEDKKKSLRRRKSTRHRGEEIEVSDLRRSRESRRHRD